MKSTKEKPKLTSSVKPKKVERKKLTVEDKDRFLYNSRDDEQEALTFVISSGYIGNDSGYNTYYD